MSYLPDDCSECRVCGVPIYGAYGGVCSNCEIPRDANGRFVKRTTPEWMQGYEPTGAEVGAALASFDAYIESMPENTDLDALEPMMRGAMRAALIAARKVSQP